MRGTALPRRPTDPAAKRRQCAHLHAPGCAQILYSVVDSRFIRLLSGMGSSPEPRERTLCCTALHSIYGRLPHSRPWVRDAIGGVFVAAAAEEEARAALPLGPAALLELYVWCVGQPLPWSPSDAHPPLGSCAAVCTQHCTWSRLPAAARERAVLPALSPAPAQAPPPPFPPLRACSHHRRGVRTAPALYAPWGSSLVPPCDCPSPCYAVLEAQARATARNAGLPAPPLAHAEHHKAAYATPRPALVAMAQCLTFSPPPQ